MNLTPDHVVPPDLIPVLNPTKQTVTPPHTPLSSPQYTNSMSTSSYSIKRKLSHPITNIQFVCRLNIPPLTSLLKTLPSTQLASASLMSTYRNAVSSLPTTATYSVTTLYLVCQFQFKPTDDTGIADSIATMHNNGVAPTFINPS